MAGRLKRIIKALIKERGYLRWRLKHKKRLYQFGNKHAGEKCFIIGNGPSLSRMDLSLLNDCKCFGLNKIHLLLNESDFKIDYHVAVNPFVIEQSAGDFAALDCPSFLSFRGSKNREIGASNSYYIRTGVTPLYYFSRELHRSLWEGHTVTFVAMQIAFYMGFSEVYLIGVDHNFKAQGDPNETQFLEGPDPNHFHPDYFSNQQWQLPDLEGSELAYHMAKFHFERDGRKIYDATLDGKLEIFPKISFEDAVAACRSNPLPVE
jgi:hypothetical protein